MKRPPQTPSEPTTFLADTFFWPGTTFKILSSAHHHLLLATVCVIKLALAIGQLRILQRADDTPDRQPRGWTTKSPSYSPEFNHTAEPAQAQVMASPLP